MLEEGGSSSKRTKAQAPGPLSCEESAFGSHDGQEVHRYDLSNGSMSVSLTNYGATILSVKAPDEKGEVEEVTLQRPDLDGLVSEKAYLGSTVGRIANRVANGRFKLDGKEYEVAVNNGPNHLHGGLVGLDKRVWEAEKVELSEGRGVGVRLKYVSPDGEEGYPGTVTFEVLYALRMDNQLEMDFRAHTDAATPVALTNHAYWNLSGGLKQKVTEGHTLRVAASRFCVLGDNMIPTGELRSVDDTPFDLRKEEVLGDRVPQVDGGGKPGYDHCFMVDDYEPLTGGESDAEVHAKLRLMATLRDPASGRAMDVYGTQPGIQVYTANFLSEDPADAPSLQHNACCLETEFPPNAVNDERLGSDIVVTPGKPYRHLTVHKFYIRAG